MTKKECEERFPSKQSVRKKESPGFLLMKTTDIFWELIKDNKRCLQASWYESRISASEIEVGVILEKGVVVRIRPVLPPDPKIKISRNGEEWDILTEKTLIYKGNFFIALFLRRAITTYAIPKGIGSWAGHHASVNILIIHRQESMKKRSL